MVQILQRPESSSDRFAKAFGNMSRSLSTQIPEELLGQKERKQLSSLMGQDVSQIRNEDFLKQILGSHLEKENQREKLAGEYQADQESYDKIKKAFGEKFADIWVSSPTGARTALTQAALDARSRGIDLDQILGGLDGESPEGAQENFAETQEDFSSPDLTIKKPGSYKLNTEGMTPKEVVEYKSSLRKENMPIWKETIDQLKDFKALDTDVSILEKINEKKNLPEGLEKLLIDPETGAPYPLGTLIKSPSRDVQQWAKTIARQATKARTAFPGRVTNFDLAAYMRQFPGLFNTYDGRKIILQQMRLTNKANLLISEAMDKVYSKYKLSGITPEDAFEKARSKVDKELSKIDQQLIDLAGEGEILADSGQETGGKMIDVIGPDGKIYELDEKEIDLLPEGFRVK